MQQGGSGSYSASSYEDERGERGVPYIDGGGVPYRLMREPGEPPPQPTHQAAATCPQCQGEQSSAFS